MNVKPLKHLPVGMTIIYQHSDCSPHAQAASVLGALLVSRTARAFTAGEAITFSCSIAAKMDDRRGGAQELHGFHFESPAQLGRWPRPRSPPRGSPRQRYRPQYHVHGGTALKRCRRNTPSTPPTDKIIRTSISTIFRNATSRLAWQGYYRRSPMRADLQICQRYHAGRRFRPPSFVLMRPPGDCAIDQRDCAL